MEGKESMIVFVQNDGRIRGRIDAATEDDIQKITWTPPETIPIFLNDGVYGGIVNDLGNYIIENDTPVYSPLPPGTPQPAILSQQEQIDNLNKQLATLSDTTDFLLGM